MNYTTIEQSKKLLELGLNPESADMFWQSNLNGSDRQYLLDMGEEEYFDIEINFEHCSIGDYDIPAWSLGALLELIPDIPDCTILFAKSECEYGMCITPLDSGLALNEIEANNPFEVVYNMIVWLLENGYIKTEKK